ncbi:hypothetical protein [Desulfobacter vibrioformis]|uniref:hypothetical protein n=2 Tax=Desulfobacter TaxID=2289 RepID=UPI00146FFC57|nr:hypothetical protein [Desulfobacter vibrioformis]
MLAGLKLFTVKNSDSPCILKSHIQPFITGKVQGPNGNRTIQTLLSRELGIIYKQSAEMIYEMERQGIVKTLDQEKPVKGIRAYNQNE